MLLFYFLDQYILFDKIHTFKYFMQLTKFSVSDG